MRTRIAIVLLSTVASIAQGQIRGSGGFSSPARISSSGSRPTQRARGAYSSRMGYRHSNRSALFLGDPFYYADEGSDGGTGQPGPAIVVVQAPPAAAPEAPQEPRGQPMIIELQGDRYVKLDKDAVAKRVIATPQAPVKPASKKIGAAKAAKQTQPVSANVVLVFRDGHREEIRDYTIADDVLYARSDSSSSGEQTKKIQISALNVPATQAANQAHGKQFLLPAGPNQVVTTF